jgi:biotin carboxyl carrier protein
MNTINQTMQIIKRLSLPQGWQRIQAIVAGQPVTLFFQPHTQQLNLQGLNYSLNQAATQGKAQSKIPENQICAAMAGKVTEIACQVGEHISPGQVLLVLEAMKMRLEVVSKQAGQIEEIAVDKGQIVSFGQILIQIVLA